MKMSSVVRACLIAGLLYLCVGTAFAGDIPAEPGNGTITTAAAKAVTGDVIILQAGEYHDAVTLPAGVTLRGAGAQASILIPTDRTAINCSGPRVTIQDLTLRGGKGAFRGINTNTSVRVERVRFEKFEHAIAMMQAPLSDVLACEFIDCEIGVRAIGGASPTVMGCAFKGGRIGFFGMKGGPYLRNNLFLENAEGIRHLCEMASPTIRNNVFKGCTSTGITILSKDKPTPIIRNNLFVDCPTAIETPAPAYAGLVSHAVLSGVGDLPVRDDKQNATADPQAIGFVRADPGLTITNTFEIKIGDATKLKGQGIRLCTDEPGTKGDIGPAGITQFGTRLALGDEAAPIRWTHPDFIANCVDEEYQTLRMLGLGMGEQSLQTGPRGHMDVMDTGGDSLRFHLFRFYGDNGLTP